MSKKRLATAALAGLFTVGTLSACAMDDKDGAHSYSASGCNAKKEAHSCEGKSGCEGKHACDANGCPAHH